MLASVYATIYISLGILLGIISGSTTSLTLILVMINASVAAIVVGVAYGLNKSELTMKTVAREFLFLRYLVFWPFLLMNQVALCIYRLCSSERLMVEIIPGLYVGGKPLIFDCGLLKKNRILSVIDVTAEFEEANVIRRNFDYHCFPILDNLSPSLEQLHQIIDKISLDLQQGGVLVHCAYGHSRSATFVAAYLMSLNPSIEVREVLEMVKRKRPKVKLTLTQRYVLNQFSRERL